MCIWFKKIWQILNPNLKTEIYNVFATKHLSNVNLGTDDTANIILPPGLLLEYLKSTRSAARFIAKIYSKRTTSARERTLSTRDKFIQ